MKHIGQTPRLTLRETSPLDGNMFYQLNSDPDVIKYTGDAPFDSVADASQFLADYDQFRKYNRGRWAIVERIKGTLLKLHIWRCNMDFVDCALIR